MSRYRTERRFRLLWRGFWILFVGAHLAYLLLHLGGLEVDLTTGELVLVITLLGLGILALIAQSKLDRQARRLGAERGEAVRQVERRSLFLNSLVEHAPLAIVALDPNHFIKVCNPAFEKLFGYSRSEAIGRRLDQLITREGSVQEAQEITQRVEEGQSIQATVIRSRKDGTAIMVELTGVPMTENGELVGIFAVYQDISERIEALSALRESEARYRSLVEHAPEAIAIFDMDTGHFVDCNKKALGLFGLGKTELLGRGPAELSPPRQPGGEDSASLARRRLREAAQGGQPVFEWMHRNSRGEDIPCEIRLSRFPSSDRTLIRGSIIDITERLSLQQQLRQAQRMEAVGQLAGGVAHDFNNLLTVISGYCNLATMRQDLPQGARDQLNEIRRASDRASALTRQLLAFSRRQVMQPEEVDLNRVVLDIEDMLQRLLGESIEFSSQLDLALDWLHIDPGQIEQVIVNLVVNARDAMPEGGSLVVETRNQRIEAADLEPGSSMTPGAYVALEVRDTGTGMDAETLEHLFEPFFTTKERGKGTGLGLSTVYGIVRQSGGRIDVDSRPGKGSSFRVLLPSMAPAAERREEITASTPRGGSEVVLIVEDEEMVRNLTRNILSESGYKVLTASTGDEAIEFALRERSEIDLLLTDIVLPGLNGRQVAERIESVVDGVKVLYMSGYAEDLTLAGNEPLNGAAFLQKPFTPSGLVSKVRQVLDRESPQPAS